MTYNEIVYWIMYRKTDIPENISYDGNFNKDLINIWKQFRKTPVPEIFRQKKIPNTVFENSVCAVCFEENITTYNCCKNKHSDGLCENCLK